MSVVNKKTQVVAIAAASCGNLVYWYDFYIYAFFAMYFAPIVFPTADPTIQLLNTAGIFAIGFIARPIGSWIFGRIADRQGRKKSLAISLSMMCIGSLVIFGLPPYDLIGVWSPVILVLARLFQGIAIGGGYGAMATYMSEVAIEGRRGFYASFQYVTLVGGQLLAMLSVIFLQLMLDEDALKSFGWRLPFLIGALAALVIYPLQHYLPETISDTNKLHKKSGDIFVLFRDHKATFFTVVGYTAGGSLCFYTFTVYMQKYLVNTVHLPIEVASELMASCLFVYMVMQPLFGALSDRIGRRSNMLLFGALGSASVVPILFALQQVTKPMYAFILVMLSLIITSFYSSVSGIVKAEMFPEHIRTVGVGLSFAIGNAVFGGSAEYIALYLKSIGYETAFYWYVTVILILTFFVSLRLPRKNAGFLKH